MIVLFSATTPVAAVSSLPATDQDARPVQHRLAVPKVPGQDPGAVESILQLLRDRDDQIKRILGPEGAEYTPEQRGSLKEIINGIIDFSRMARYALDATYDTISAQDQAEFVSLFGAIIRDQSLNKLDIYRARVRYDSVQVEGTRATVSTTAEYEQVRTPVTYDMWLGQQGWVITDMVIDDVSTAESYRRQFQSIIRQRGFDALLGSLRKRAQRIGDDQTTPPR